MQIPVIPEDIFFTNEFTEVAKLEDGITTATGLVSEIFIQEAKNDECWFFIYTEVSLVILQDCIPLVDQQLLYTCCPFLGEWKDIFYVLSGIKGTFKNV